MSEPVCPLCNDPHNPILVDRDYQYASGWVRRRDQGGTNALKLRVVHDKWAHKVCVDRARDGIHSRQDSLL